MPPSQLKRLKASLRDQGVIGPQKSKKQKKQSAQNGANVEKRMQRAQALIGIREKFNPFEYKTNARGTKFDVTSNKTISGRVAKTLVARPGIMKGLGEESRRKTLLVEMHRRNKVGGIMDRRFGENDPTMAPEDKLLERFTQEKQRRHKTSSAFDLEDNEESGELTHMGQSLSLDGPALEDDFDEEGLVLSDAEDHQSDLKGRLSKRRRNSETGELEVHDVENQGEPERKKTKQEVMKEVIAKSKFYKYERQAAKDEDEDLRQDLDKEMGEIQALLRGTIPRASGTSSAKFEGMNPERAALLNGIEKAKFDKEYDLRLRQMAQDKKSNPTERTKTEEEKIAEESRRLQDLEARRLRRMQGPDESGDESPIVEGIENDETFDDEEDYGFGTGLKVIDARSKFSVEDEDDFIIDDNLVASGSDVDTSDEENSSPENAESDDFLDGLLTEEESKRPDFLTGANGRLEEEHAMASNSINNNLPYSFPCPQSHEEFLQITRSIALQDITEVVRRVRVIYHPKLKSENKARLGKFTEVVVDHISFLANNQPLPSFSVLDGLIRHTHSLAKMFPIETANSFRKHLREQSISRVLTPTVGDLVLAAATGAIFPTSDHFHQVVTPAVLSLARYLGQKIPHHYHEYATGLYISTVSLQYQKLSKRYVPELVSFLLNTLYAFVPIKPLKIQGSFTYHESRFLPLRDAHSIQVRKLQLSDIVATELSSAEEALLKAALIETSVRLLDAAADVWIGKQAFQEIFTSAHTALRNMESDDYSKELPESTQKVVSKALQKLERLLQHARRARRPLQMHHHRPLAIKTSIPKFEESFNPDKHYDPDRDRADASKLRAQHKKERKGAMRELRKDGNFIARESLREKKEKDAAYEKKYKRLVAEIQGEEGKEAKAYEREKQWRKKGRK